eukprot:TRINITY_DN4650_c0_g1_i2.p1 TRINITY_DN4650_c0_g1~~TRINITY_DN4650_c0_g1_i2.p1  ORF type:complete len:304 (+),score=37.00 TRINITY_DN4650_c0_g1_i2:100-1011(+)
MVSRLTYFVVFLFLCWSTREAWWRLGPPASWEEFRGEWALVTGSSYGIGKDFVVHLAAKGMNVVIHGRSRSKLEILAKEIVTNYSVQVRSVVQDVVEAPNWDEMAKLIEDLKITVLINNVGGGSLDGKMYLMHERSLSYHTKIHDLNFGAALGWTSLVLPKMVLGKKGRIISCSSLGYLFGYGESIYGSDKGALNSLTLSLNNEYINHGVRAESLIIGLVSTPAVPLEPDLAGYVLDSETVARNALNLFGWKEIYAPGFSHSLFHFMGTILPTQTRAKIVKEGTDSVMEAVRLGRERINRSEL